LYSKRAATRVLLAGLCLLAAAFVRPVSAEPPPPLPHAFYGAVEVNGEPAPAGTQVEARGAGVLTGVLGNPITVTQARPVRWAWRFRPQAGGPGSGGRWHAGGILCGWGQGSVCRGWRALAGEFPLRVRHDHRTESRGGGAGGNADPPAHGRTDANPVADGRACGHSPITYTDPTYTDPGGNVYANPIHDGRAYAHQFATGAFPNPDGAAYGCNPGSNADPPSDSPAALACPNRDGNVYAFSLAVAANRDPASPNVGPAAGDCSGYSYSRNAHGASDEGGTDFEAGGDADSYSGRDLRIRGYSQTLDRGTGVPDCLRGSRVGCDWLSKDPVSGVPSRGTIT